MARCTRSISPASPKPLSSTSAPAAANCRAMPRPMPEVDPVMTATLSWSVIEAFSSRQRATLSIGHDGWWAARKGALRRASPTGSHGGRHLGLGRLLQDLADEVAGFAKPIEINPSLNIEAVQHVDDILGRYVAGRS